MAEPLIEIFPDELALAQAAAARVAGLARAAIGARGRFSVALAGGATPRPLYARLARAPELDWSHVEIYWGDERCVPPEHPASNYRMARETLLDRVAIPPHHVHRIAGEHDPERAARAYEDLLRARFGAPEGPPARSFDLVLLGMGDDGHTASLFPGAPIDDARWAMAMPASPARVTLTPAVLDAAAAIVFVVAGAGKASRLRDVLEGPPGRFPAQLVRPRDGSLEWMIDAAAASRLRAPAHTGGARR